MEYLKIDGEFPRLSKSAVTLGKFDGIHRGHQKVSISSDSRPRG